MEIYSNDDIYGVRWNIRDVSFEKTYLEKMSILQIQEVKEQYNNQHNKSNFSFYKCCSSTYDTGTFMSWFPCSKDSIEDFFLKG